MAEDHGEYTVPLQDQRVFGAGIKRKRVQFIPATTDAPVHSRDWTKHGQAGNRYLSIVMPSSRSSDQDRSASREERKEHPDGSTLSSIDAPLCQICSLPIPQYPVNVTCASKPHEASLAHQVCLAHSHPPSHLERSRPGLRYLTSYGWDPDSRLGLGTAGHGIRAPIKPKVKNDTVGLGVKEPRKEARQRRRAIEEEKLDAGKVRKREAAIRKKRDSLQELFYGSEDLERYLAPVAWVESFPGETTGSSTSLNRTVPKAVR
ncbi:hypothetical protein MMC16_005284 [Acarospora aff. strigata]|nr:hypothetical protein [Acarospora aff. strigata]